jgi:ABC-type multidrug transport system permease subunit
MQVWTYLTIGLILAILGALVGASTVVSQKRDTPTQRPERTQPSPHSQRPSRQELFLPMVGLLGVSFFLLIVGYTTINIVAAAVGFLLLFLGFGLLGAFLFNEIF